MATEEELEKQVQAQARRVQPEDNAPGDVKLQAGEVDSEAELRIAKQEQERILLYSEDTSD